MIIKNLAFIITDTPRAYIYLQILIKNNILPNYFIYLQNHRKKNLPENSKNKINKFIVPKEYVKICGSTILTNFDVLNEIKKLDISYDIYKSTNIHNSSIIKKIQSRTEKTFIYAGYSGVILKKNILDTNKNFLHIHGGYLPKYKGSTTNYYSILEENTIGASAIFLNQKIDSGKILMSSKFKIPKKKSEIDDFYDSFVRGILLLKTIKSYYKNKKWPIKKVDKLNNKNYYIIHPLLKHVAILSLK